MFQIFLPDVQTNREAALDEVGLGDLVEHAMWREDLGPEGRPGAFAFWHSGTQRRSGYQPALQEWVPAVPFDGLPGGRYWLGFWNDEELTPGVLRRPYPFSGKRLTLGDGQPWIVPTMEALPRTAMFQDDGSVKYELQRRYHALYLDSQQWLEWLNAAAATANGQLACDLSDSDRLRYIVALLRLNYRLTPEVISRRELLVQEFREGQPSLLLQIVLASLGLTVDGGTAT